MFEKALERGFQDADLCRGLWNVRSTIPVTTGGTRAGEFCGNDEVPDQS